MTVPANFQSAIDANNVGLRRWIEIEGIPYAYGEMTQAAGFFSARAANQQFLGIRQYLVNAPKNVDQQVDTLEGGALTVGQVDFELNDVDDVITELTGVGRSTNQLILNGDHSASATTFTFFGSSANYVAGGYFYIGTETIKIGAKVGQTFTGCTRAQFRSKAQAWGSGYPISDRPYALANRRCWYNEVAINLLNTTSFTSTEPDKCVRFAGLLRNLALKQNTYTTYVLTAESMDRELNRPCFRTLRKFELAGNKIADGQGKDGNTYVGGWPGASNGSSYLYNFNTLDFPTLGESMLFKIDNEIFYLTRLGASGLIPASMRLVSRDLYGSCPDGPPKHEEGALCQELAPVVAYDSGSNDPARYVSRFRSTPTATAPVQADHPLMIVLQVLLSTGAGTNTPGGGARNYDVLPTGWGMGVDYDRVDIQGIEAAAMEEPNLRFGGFVDRPQNFVEFARGILRMAGYYFIITIGDKFTIKRLRPPLPDVATTTISNANRIRNFFTRWEANWSGAVRELIFKYGWDINEGKFKRVDILISDDGDVYSKGLARSLVFESKLLYPGHSGIAGEIPNAQFDVTEWLLTRKDFYRTRYGLPPPVIHERVDYSYIDLEIGDLVAVTHTHLPDAATGARGLSGAVGEVISKSIDEQSKTIQFTILMTGWKLGQYRFIAPALKVTQIDDVDNLIVATNQYTETVGPNGATQSDIGYIASDGSVKRPFAAGSKCWVWSEDFSVKQAATVDTNGVYTIGADKYINIVPDSGSGTWNTAIIDGGGALVGNPHITLRDYQTVKASAVDVDDELAEATYAFGCDGTDTLGTTPDSAHKYFPL